MPLFKLCRPSPDRRTARERLNKHRKARPGRLVEPALFRPLRILKPRAPPVLFFHIQMYSRLHNCLRRERAAVLLALFRFLQPLLPTHNH